MDAETLWLADRVHNVIESMRARTRAGRPLSVDELVMFGRLRAELDEMIASAPVTDAEQVRAAFGDRPTAST